MKYKARLSYGSIIYKSDEENNRQKNAKKPLDARA
jgi:hypothetical protein